MDNTPSEHPREKDSAGAQVSGETKWGGHGVGWIETMAIEIALSEMNDRRHRLHRSLLPKILSCRGAAGMMNPSLDTLSKLTGWSQRSVKRALHDLKEWGLLEWQTGGLRRAGRKIPNHYKIGPVLAECMNKVGMAAAVGQNEAEQRGGAVGQNEQSAVGQNEQSAVGQNEQSAVGQYSGPLSTSKSTTKSLSEHVPTEFALNSNPPEKGKKKLKPTDPRHQRFMELIDKAHRYFVKQKNGEPMPPLLGAAAGKNLKRLLAAYPTLHEKQFKSWLTNYHESDNHNPHDTPAHYILKLPAFEGGPLNKFGRLDE